MSERILDQEGRGRGAPLAVSSGTLVFLLAFVLISSCRFLSTKNITINLEKKNLGTEAIDV